MSAYGSPEWVISLWLNNDQGAQELANEAMSHPVSISERGGDLRTWFDEMYVEPLSDEFAKGIFRDLINHADWNEIAEAVWVDE